MGPFQTISIGTIFGIVVGLILSVRFGLIGLMIGVYLGNYIDKTIKVQIKTSKSRVRRKNQWSMQTIEYSYQLMGHLAKFDGPVSENSISLVENSMSIFKFTNPQKQKAKTAFNNGKKETFNPFIAVQQLQLALLMQPSIKSHIAGILIQLIEINPKNSSAKISRLNHILKSLGIYGYNRYSHQEQPLQGNGQNHNLDWAYKTLGVKTTSAPDEIKRKYRKLLSDNHPDKVHAKNKSATEVDIKRANDKTFEIKKAYTLIKSHLASTQT